jgi:hypothetical protein
LILFTTGLEVFVIAALDPNLDIPFEVLPAFSLASPGGYGLGNGHIPNLNKIYF